MKIQVLEYRGRGAGWQTAWRQAEQSRDTGPDDDGTGCVIAFWFIFIMLALEALFG